VWLTIPQIETIVTSTIPPRWVTALRRVTVTQNFDFQLYAFYRDYYQPYEGLDLSDIQMNQMQMGLQEKFKLLMANSLSMGTTNDVPDLGLEWLFERF
jgi:hypothetical protein